MKHMTPVSLRDKLLNPWPNVRVKCCKTIADICYGHWLARDWPEWLTSVTQGGEGEPTRRLFPLLTPHSYWAFSSLLGKARWTPLWSVAGQGWVGSSVCCCCCCLLAGKPVNVLECSSEGCEGWTLRGVVSMECCLISKLLTWNWCFQMWQLVKFSRCTAILSRKCHCRSGVRVLTSAARAHGVSPPSLFHYWFIILYSLIWSYMVSVLENVF